MTAKGSHKEPRRMARAAAMVIACVSGAGAHAEMSWRAKPEIASEPAMAHGGHGGHGREGRQRFYLRDGAGAEANLRLPTLESKPVPLEGGAAPLPVTGKDGYHLLLARRAEAGEEQVALRYLYTPGKPTGHSPTELLAEPSARLEIVPTPLPREHWRYESGEPAAFTIRFDGEPLVAVPVRMVTSNGTLLEEVADAGGRVRFALPEDFARVRAGREANASADFVVSVAHEDGANRFTTTLNADYFVNPSHWQSIVFGLVTLLGGFALGLFAVRPREEKKA